MRSLPRPSGNVFLGDVVAFRPPPGIEGSLLVRRIAAVEGEEMVSDDPEDTAFTLPSGMATSMAFFRSECMSICSAIFVMC